MASEKFVQILRKYESPFTEQQICSMSDGDAYLWIRNFEKAAREQKAKTKLPEVCFTGFNNSEKELLTKIAEEAGYKVKDSVTKNLVLLVTGDDPGPSKLVKAEAQGCTVIDVNGFLAQVGK